MTPLSAHLLALSLVLPAGIAAVGPPRKASALPPAEAALLASRCDQSLESMRAGRVEGPAPIAEDERAELRAMQAQSGDLENLRAGGAGGLLLILAVILLVLILI